MSFVDSASVDVAVKLALAGEAVLDGRTLVVRYAKKNNSNKDIPLRAKSPVVVPVSGPVSGLAGKLLAAANKDS